MFQVSPHVLEQLLKINQFPGAQADEELIFFGIRGATPASPDNQSWQQEITLSPSPVNYVNPRCTLIQYDVKKKLIAAFPGSTVPHLSYVKDAMANGGLGANQLLTGMYKYQKGIHKKGTKTAHQAFVEYGDRCFRRTTNDTAYNADDPVDTGDPCDNNHAGWCASVSSNYYASAGCEVVVGYPSCPARGSLPDSGPWATYKANAYALQQAIFRMAILNATEYTAVAGNPYQVNASHPMILRFGSQGTAVEVLQNILIQKGYLKGPADGVFGAGTVNAVLAFQTKAFGPSGDDGIVGGQTAQALGFNLPNVLI